MENLEEDTDCQELPVNYSLKYYASDEEEDEEEDEEPDDDELPDIIVCDSYVETDLDQIVDYSRKYPERDSNDEEKIIRLHRPAPRRTEFRAAVTANKDEPSPKSSPSNNEDTVKIYCSEDPPVVNSEPEKEFEEAVNETPLMFSRSSSLTSLSSFDPPSGIRSSVSEVSYVSGTVSPSDLPDSPGQTMPPSPIQKKPSTFFNDDGSDLQDHRFSSKALENFKDYNGGVFDDNNCSFVVEGTPVLFSGSSSLSSLSITSDSDDLKKFYVRDVSSSDTSDGSKKTVVDSFSTEYVSSPKSGKSENACNGNDEDIVFHNGIQSGGSELKATESGETDDLNHTASFDHDSDEPRNFTSVQDTSNTNGTQDIEVTVAHKSSSDSEYEDDQELLMQCIKAGMPKKNSPMNNLVKSHEHLQKPVIICSSDCSEVVKEDIPIEQEKSELSSDSEGEDNQKLLLQCIEAGMPKKNPTDILMKSHQHAQKTLTISTSEVNENSRLNLDSENEQDDPKLIMQCIEAGMPKKKNIADNFEVKLHPGALDESKNALHIIPEFQTHDGLISHSQKQVKNTSTSECILYQCNADLYDGCVEESRCHMIENTPISFSRCSSLSSLTIASDDELLAQNQVKLEECIQMGMPKPKDTKIHERGNVTKDSKVKLGDSLPSAATNNNLSVPLQKCPDVTTTGNEHNQLLDHNLLKEERSKYELQKQISTIYLAERNIHDTKIDVHCDDGDLSNTIFDAKNKEPIAKKATDGQKESALEKLESTNGNEKSKEEQNKLNTSQDSDSSCNEEDKKLLLQCIQAGIPKKKETKYNSNRSKKCFDNQKCNSYPSSSNSRTSSSYNASPNKTVQMMGNYVNNEPSASQSLMYKYSKGASTKVRTRETQRRSQRSPSMQSHLPVSRESSKVHNSYRKMQNYGRTSSNFRSSYDVQAVSYGHYTSDGIGYYSPQNHSHSSSIAASDEEISPQDKALVEACIRMGMPKPKDKGKVNTNNRKKSSPCQQNASESSHHKDFQRSSADGSNIKNSAFPVQYTYSQPVKKSREHVAMPQHNWNNMGYGKKLTSVSSKNIPITPPYSTDQGVRQVFAPNKRTLLDKCTKVEVAQQKPLPPAPPPVVPDQEDSSGEKTSPEIRLLKLTRNMSKLISKNSFFWSKNKPQVKNSSYELNNNEISMKNSATQTDLSCPQDIPQAEVMTKRNHSSKSSRKYL